MKGHTRTEKGRQIEIETVKHRHGHRKKHLKREGEAKKSDGRESSREKEK